MRRAVASGAGKAAVCILLSLSATAARADESETSNTPVVQSAQRVPDDAQDLVLMAPTRPLLVRLRIRIDGKPLAQVWRDRFDMLLAEHAEGAAAGIDAKQAAAICDLMNGQLPGASPAAAARDDLKQLLASSGDKLTREALLDYLQANAGPFAVQLGATIGRGAGPALFPLLDTDGDGRLSADELKSAEQRLRGRDFDDDQLLTDQELVLDYKPTAEELAGGGAGEASAASTSGPVFVLTPKTAPAALAEAILKRYDRDHDGRLSTAGTEAEVILAQPALVELDANADGLLDAAELARFARRRPDIELKFALGRVGSSSFETRSRSASAESGEFRVRKKIDGGYKLSVGDVEIDFRRNNRDPAQASQQEYRFANFDRDNNGYIDEAEAKANPLIAGAFSSMDADHDGKVNRAEFKQYIDRRGSAASARVLLEVHDQGRDLFSMFDTNHDRALSPRELREAVELLKSADKNGDGYLSGGEIPQQFLMELSRGISVKEPAAGVVMRTQPRTTGAKAPAAGPLWFRKMDRNGDGDVSADEFLGTPEDFRKLDANHDGLISADEAAKAK